MSRIDQPWPIDDTENVDSCPYCQSVARIVAHREIQDWSFYCAPGKWTYWSCSQCSSLYLSPRPTVDTIGSAYSSYYTHSAARTQSFVQSIRARLINECWSHWLCTDLRPRFHVPTAARWLLNPLKARLAEPFVLAELLKLPKGRLMDVGCGNGQMIELAKQLGWAATGLESDPVAVRSTRARGLDVIEGSYVRLSEFPQDFDCIICSHVLEHVHYPLDLLRRIAGALKDGGTLLLATPNASSVMRRHFGDDWRGLEAPRHLSIPSMVQLEANLREMGFTVRRRNVTRLWTAVESSRIRRRGKHIVARDKAVARELAARQKLVSDWGNDFADLVCLKGTPGVP